MYPSSSTHQIPAASEKPSESLPQKRQRVISGLMKRKNNIHIALAAALATTGAAVVGGCSLIMADLCDDVDCDANEGGSAAGGNGTGGEAAGGNGTGGEATGGNGTGGEATGGNGTGGETTGGGGTGGTPCIPTGPEVCDGLDNDCQNGIDDSLTTEPCAEPDQGECLGATAARTCDGVAGWSTCDYGQNYETVTELSCDTFDNNCDGSTDEGCVTVSGTLCDKVWHFPAAGNDTFLAGSSAHDNTCEVSNNMTFMTSTGSHLVIWEDNQNFINLITNDTVLCFAECSLYGSIPPNHTEALTDKNRTFDDVVVVTPNGNDLKEEHQKICQAHTFSCVMQ